MATLLQRELAQNIVKNAKRTKKLNKKELVVSSGYSEITGIAHAGEIIAQKGVQEELENLGFDIDSAKKVVQSILKRGREENRLKAAQEVFKVEGAYAPEKRVNLNITPIYGGRSLTTIQGHDSDAKDIPTNKEDTGS